MSKLREAAEKALKALDVATTPLAKDRQEVLSAMAALRAELAKPDARPAPAEPQGAEAPQEIKSLRDRIIEGELELDGTHPPTLMFLMAEHWKAVATEHYAKAKDYDRLKHELRLSRTAPAPRPAGGEPVAALIRHRSLQTEARIAHDGCDHYSDWSDWEPATVQHALAVTDPARNTHPLLWEARLLVDCQPQPAAQQEPLFWYRPRSDGLYEGPIHNAQIERARKESGGWVPLYTQAGERKPLTDEQIDRVLDALPDGCCDEITGAEARSFARAIEAELRKLWGISPAGADTKGEQT